ncbi:Shedu immune nuclease family protein [Flavobacterium gelatinilyticum]|uniref:Shedu immune nuclease family protein n=1 Tax=Flavobacterium gelatinilyticum TaxID=3003260 RepID=UPI0024816B9C|nr:Shedu immune nuclease family protein [Flavobacterium gelatinilyticum]
MTHIPQKENITKNDVDKLIYEYCDINGKPIFKAIEVDKKGDKIILNLYRVNRKTDDITFTKLKKVEFVGWSNLHDLPAHFKKVYSRTEYYGIHSKSLKRLLRTLSYKFKDLEKITVSKTGNTRFNKKSISFLWSDLEPILKNISRDSASNEKNTKLYINNELAKLTSKFVKEPKNLYYGDLERFMGRYDTFDKITDSDVASLSSLLNLLPKNKISVTSNFIKTKDKINIAFFEDILDQFKKLRSVASDNEKDWQKFFEKNAWIFSHLFPYDVILREREAYVGGKTFENKDGKIVDFLYQNGFKDNYALIEIKTHKKDLLKNLAYRGTDVFSMSEDLSGGINQCLDQKDNFIKEFGKEYKPIEPKCILVIGQRNKLKAEQVKCFELIRANQKNVDIVTFDELENKIEGLLKVLSN